MSKEWPRGLETVLEAACAGHGKDPMLDWMKRRRLSGRRQPEADKPGRVQLRAMSGKYALLHQYLQKRYADTVVLTFGEIEDLLGFPLPAQSRLHREWWMATDTAADQDHSDSWMLAGRTATPDLLARTVVFERAL
ncbi:MAG: hypothetical protein GEU82_08455 [Luteitalea sp.]|nr:hypothetical protein [Luteitalea sp.]